MKKKLINLLKNSNSIRIHFIKKGMLFFDGKILGGSGYLLQNGKVIEVPINSITLSMN